jgi:hypothetical protein
MFTRNIIISQQSFINIVNTSSTIFRKRIQKFSFPIHPGLMTIKHNRDDTFSMYYNMKNNMNIKNKKSTSKIHELHEGKLIVWIPHIDYEHVINCFEGANLNVNWDKYDELRDLSLVNNEDFNYMLPHMVNDVPHRFLN